MIYFIFRFLFKQLNNRIIYDNPSSISVSFSLYLNVGYNQLFIYKDHGLLGNIESPSLIIVQFETYEKSTFEHKHYLPMSNSVF